MKHWTARALWIGAVMACLAGCGSGGSATPDPDAGGGDVMVPDGGGDVAAPDGGGDGAGDPGDDLPADAPPADVPPADDPAPDTGGDTPQDALPDGSPADGVDPGPDAASDEGQDLAWDPGPDAGVAPEGTVLVAGLLVLPSDLDPRDWQVGNRYGTASPAADGRFVLPVATQGVTVATAIPRAYAGDQNIYLAVFPIVPLEDPPPLPPLVVDAFSTARALLVLNPYFLTPNPFLARTILDATDVSPAVAALASWIAAHYPTRPLALEDAEFLDLYVKALEETSTALPQTLLPGVGGARLSGDPWVSAVQTDMVAQVELGYEAGTPGRITVAGATGAPLDVFLRLDEVDLDAEHDLWSPEGTETFRLRSAADVEDQRSAGIRFADSFAYPVYRTRGGSTPHAVASANSLFKVLDLVGLVLDKLADLVGLGSDSNALQVPGGDRDAVYVVRGFTGRLGSGPDKGEFRFAWEHYKEDMLVGLGVNVINAVVDAISILVDMKEMVDSCVGKLGTAVFVKASQTVSNLTPSQEGDESVLWPLLTDLGKEGVSSLFGCIEERIKEDWLRGLGTVMKGLLKTVDLLGKVSKIGALADRLAGLVGAPSPGVVTALATMFTSPMETFLVRVGDPFSPRVLNVEGQDVDPTGAAAPPLVRFGATVTVRGKRFGNPGEAAPRVFLNDENGRYVAAADAQVTGPVEDQVLTFAVADGVAGRLRLVFQRERARHVTADVVEVIPEVFAVDPADAFPRDPDAVVSGLGDLRITGRGLVPARHLVRLGAASLPLKAGGGGPSERSTDTTAWFDASSVPVGKHDLFLDYGRTELAGGAPLYVRVLGAPVLEDILPARPAAGLGAFVVRGRNFGVEVLGRTTRFPLDVWCWTKGAWRNCEQVGSVVTTGGGDDQLSQVTVRFPSQASPEAGDAAQVKVQTPEGTSETISFTVADDTAPPGLARSLFPGAGLTPDEAVMMANGAQPQAVFTREGHWHPCGVDPVVPECYLHCVTIVSPEGYQAAEDTDWSWNHDGSVSRPSAWGTPECPAGDTGVPNTWAGLPASAILDTLQMDAHDSALPLPTTPVAGPWVDVMGRATGGGLVVQGIPGAQNHVNLSLTVLQATGTVVTVDGADGVTVDLGIVGAGCDTGLLIRNSRNVHVTGALIYDCATGIRIQDSEDVRIDVAAISGYTGTAIELDGAVRVVLAGANLGLDDRVDPNRPVVPPGQGTGLYLHGGTRDCDLRFSVSGGVKGAVVEDATDNRISFGQIGTYGWIPPEGSAELDVGIELRDGADRNRVGGGEAGNCRVCLLLTGGQDNRIEGGQFGTNHAVRDADGQAIPGRYQACSDAGIWLDGTAGTGPARTILGNPVKTVLEADYSRHGIRITGVTSDTWLYRVVGNNNAECGLRIDGGSRNVQVVDLYAGGNGTGVCVAEASSGVTLVGSMVSSNLGDGVRIEDSHDVRLSRGHSRYNLASGVHVLSSSAVQVRRMPLEENEGDGLEIEGVPVGSAGRLVVGEVKEKLATSVARKDWLDPLTGPPAAGGGSLDGLVLRRNGGHGVHIHGGATDVEVSRVLAYGNAGAGVRIDGAAGDVVVAESAMGDLAGGSGEANGEGVLITDSTGVLVGGPRRGNLVSDNLSHGIRVVDSSDVRIEGNYVGTDEYGGFPDANGGDGIRVEGGLGVTIGGGIDEANLVSGNLGDGISIDLANGSGGHRVEGNFVGVAWDALTACANGGSGVRLANGGSFGPMTTVANNLVGGNAADGVSLDTVAEVWVTRNVVGRAPAQGGAPNGIAGISVRGSAGVVLLQNHVAWNPADGIILWDGARGSQVVGNTVTRNAFHGVGVSGWDSVGNRISRNTIHRNGGLGIALAGAANGAIPAPVIRSQVAAGAGAMSFQGEVDPSVPDGSVVDLFVDDEDEGQSWFASAFTVNHRFFAWNALSPPAKPFAGNHVTATVTDAGDDTSEFGGYEPEAPVTGCDAPAEMPAGAPLLPGSVVTERGADIALSALAGADTSIAVIGDPSARDPDVCGSLVAYASDEEGTLDVFVRDLDAGTSVRLTTDAGQEYEPAFSPDCARVAFVKEVGGVPKVWVMDVDGANAGPVTTGTDPDRTPHFSPDGATIVFSRQLGDFRLYTVPSAGGTPSALFDLPGDDLRPRWAPSGDRILFNHCEMGTCRAAVYNRSSDTSRLFGSTACLDEDPEWAVAPDGTPFVLVSRGWADPPVGTPDLRHVVLLSADGYPLWRVTPDDTDDRGAACCTQ